MSPSTHLTSLTSAGIPVRLAARAIDVLILVAIDVSLGRAIGFGYNWLIVAASIVIAYFVASDVLAGATPGKAVFSLRVTSADGKRLSVKQAFIREFFILFGAVPFAGPFLALAAWTWIFVTMRSSSLRQGKHDQLAGTLVVRR